MLVYFGSLFYLEGMVDQPRKAINNFCRYTSSWLLGFSLSISLSSVSKMFCGLNVGEWLLFHIGSSLLCPFIWHSSISIDSYFTFSISRRSYFFLLCFFFLFLVHGRHLFCLPKSSMPPYACLYALWSCV